MKPTEAQLRALKKSHHAPRQIKRGDVSEEMWLQLHEAGWIVGALGSTEVATLTQSGLAALEAAGSEE